MKPRWWRLLLAALAAVLGTLLGAGTASAATLPAGETRVGAISITTPAVVGFDAGVWASQHQVHGPPQVGIVSATGVAAKGADIAEGFSSFSAAKRALGSPGAGNVYDHVVEQSQIARSGFAPELVHNPYNMKPVPALVNQVKANYYSRKFDWTSGGTVRDWLSGQSYEAQHSFGLRVLDDIQAGAIR